MIAIIAQVVQHTGTQAERGRAKAHALAMSEYPASRILSAICP